jgi:hypothetical protein
MPEAVTSRRRTPRALRRLCQRFRATRTRLTRCSADGPGPAARTSRSWLNPRRRKGTNCQATWGRSYAGGVGAAMSQFRNATAPPPRKTVFLGEAPLWQKIVLAPGSCRSATRSRREARTCRWVRGNGAAADLRQPPLRHGLKARALGPLSRNIRENFAAPLVRAEHPKRRRRPPSPGGEGGRVRPASRGPVPRRTVSPSFDTSLTLTPVRSSSQPR